MPTTLVTPEDIGIVLGRELTAAERTKMLQNIDATIENLENWARRKFTAETIYNEKHLLGGSAQSVFLRWGEPAGDVLVRYGSPTATGTTVTSDRWGTDFDSFLNSAYGHYYGGVVFVTYTVDTTKVDEYRTTLRNFIISQGIKRLLTPDVAKYNVLQGYGVEGLNIQFSQPDSAQQGGYGEYTASELAPLQGLRRRVIL